MAITIGSNIASLQSQRRLYDTGEKLATVFERLSSGQRINRAADDAAGLAVTLGLDARATVLGQAVRNVNDGISALNIVDSALSSLGGITERQIELAQQAANGSLSYQQRRALDEEYNELVAEFNRIVESTEFNGRKLLEDPDSTNLQIQAGIGDNGQIGFDLGSELARLVGTGEFSADGSFSVGSSTAATAIADLNNDGFDDLIFSGSASNTVEIRFGNAEGDLTADQSTVSNVQDIGSSLFDQIITGDFNNDGNIDLVVGAFNTQDRTISLGNGDGTFQAGQTFSYADSQNGFMYTGDFDGDSNLDILSIRTDTSISIEYGNGDGTFQDSSTVTSVNISSISVGDLNNDGRDDLSYISSGTVYVQTANADGSFTESSFSGGGGVLGIEDVNNDGNNDIITSAGFYLSNGDGTFGSIDSGGISSGQIVAVQDLNGDGIVDLLSTTSVTTAYINDGSGNFTSAGSAGVPMSDSFGDFNGDGVLESTRIVSTSIQTLSQETTGTNEIAFTSLESRAEALDALDSAQERLERINLERGVLGASLRRFDSAIEAIRSQELNSKAASSLIKDADIALESANLTRLGILRQAASSVLAQANQQPALSLLLLQ